MTVLEARYELGHRIGGGGMAEVVEAYDRKLDRRVAVKFLRDGSGDTRARERFVREAQVAAGFTHPNVVRIYDVGEWDGRPYLVMELVEGRTLAEILATRGALPVAQALSVADSLLAALAAAHEQGLVHRDVKPANVLVGRNGRVKLADFGIAKAMQSATEGLTGTGQMIGTPAYLSPEQVEGRETTARTDLYAVGVVLYEMLTGAPPFGGDHPLAVALAHRDDPVPPIEERRSDVSPALAAAVTRALEKDPQQRFESAAAMRAALADARGGGSVTGPATIAATLPEPTQTIPAPAPATPHAPGAQRRRWATPLLLVLATLLGAGAGLLLLGGGSDPQRTVHSALTLPSVATPTLPATTTSTLPQTLDALIAMLAANPGQFGDKAPELLDQLRALQEHPDPKGKRAARLIDEIDQWVADGELDAGIGALAVQILQPNAANRGGGGGD